MTDDPNKMQFGPATVEQLGQMMGWDGPRFWANNVQVFVNEDHALFVFREQMLVESQVPGPDGNSITQSMNVGKSVASIIMPLAVATEFKGVMARLFPDPAKEKE